MREILLKQGYNVGQIGTEPSAQLFGIDYCYPMGYNSSVYITGYDTIRYLNYIENDLCEQCKDIIIVGSQSGTVPYDFGNISQYTIPQYELLMGANPDCVILCINPFDEIDYIKRTVNYIESIIDCKVIALVVFPMTLNNNWLGIYGNKRPASGFQKQVFSVCPFAYVSVRFAGTKSHARSRVRGDKIRYHKAISPTACPARRYAPHGTDQRSSLSSR